MDYLRGQRLDIHSYKHNTHPHRTWDEAILLDETKNYMVFANNRTKVVESDGRSWKTKEPAIIYFYKNNWFNVIAQFKTTGLYYYCNLASPFVIEDGTIKYIDYDLDVRVFPDGSFKILDKDEYKYHKRVMEYPESIDCILKNEMNVLIDMIRKKTGPFNNDMINYYYGIYKELKKKQK